MPNRSIENLFSDLTVPISAVAEIRRTLAAAESFDDAVELFSFQEFLHKELPELESIGTALVERLETGKRFVLLKDLPFADFELPVCKFLVLALATCWGRPRPTYEFSNRLVWEVKPVKDLPPGYVTTVTEHAQDVEPHTDSSFKQHPERYVALFAVRPAQSGGLSTIVDGRKVLEQIASPGEEASHSALLSSGLFPFRRPTAFTRTRREDQPDWIEAPVISSLPLVRYRYDVIERGFQCLPDIDTRERRQALEVFRDALTRAPREIVRLAAGDLLLANNHEILHGRTTFDDGNRLLLRVRMDVDRGLI